MSSNPPNNAPTGGASAMLLNRVRQAAAKTIANATQQRSQTIGNANQQAATIAANAHSLAVNALSPKFSGAYALTDQGLFHADMQGQCAAPISLGTGAIGIAINIGTQTLYWSELQAGSSKGSPACAQPDQVVFYAEPNFAGESHQVVTPMTIDDDYTNIQAQPLSFLPANFQIGSIRVGPGTVLTIFQRDNALGAFQQFTEDTAAVNLDWQITPQSTYVISRSYHRLMSANLDGTDMTEMASLPEINSRAKTSGDVALDASRGLLFWITPAGHIVKVDFIGGTTSAISLVPGIPQGWVGIAVDPINQNTYWSLWDMFGTAPYSGGWETLVIEAHMALMEGPFPYPSDLFTLGKPATQIAVDGANNVMYCSDGQTIWPAHLDGSPVNPIQGIPMPNQVSVQRIYYDYDSKWGLTLDHASQMLYWIQENNLMRIHVDPTVTDYAPNQIAEKVCTLQGIKGHPVDLVFLASADLAAANQAVQDAHNRRQAAQNQANQTINDAHTAAVNTRQAAQTQLDDAHTTAAKNIADKQSSAASDRAQAQAAANQKQSQAAQNIKDANADANRQRAEANSNAQSYINQQQAQANQITGTAQTQLDDARRRLQNT